MSANIESMMWSGATPWHGLGTKVETEQTSENAIKLAGLDWDVSTQPLLANLAPEAGLNVDGLAAVQGFKATVRSSDKKVLGVVGGRYQPIQNADAFAFFDGIVGAGEAVYHTAGSLDSGRKIWLMAKLPQDMVIPGFKDEAMERYLLLSNSHDGSGALRAFATTVRVVCQNTLNMALRGSAGEGISIRHTRNAAARLQEAKRVFSYATAYYDSMRTVAAGLAQAKYTEKQMVSLVESIFPAESEDEVSTRTANNRALVMDLFDNGRGHQPIRGTAWAALNAVTEFVSHHRGTRMTDGKGQDESRLESIWFGSGRALSQKAFQKISADVQLAA